MRAMMTLIGSILILGTGLSVYLGAKMKVTKKRAIAASKQIKLTTEQHQARMKLRRDWDNEHAVLSDATFAGFKHLPTEIGGVVVSCPKCEEL
jgi:hypothetical protein